MKFIHEFRQLQHNGLATKYIAKATNQTESDWIFGAVILKLRFHCLRIVDLRMEFWCNRVFLF